MSEIRREIRFLLNGEEIRLSEVAPTDTLLDFLRIRKRLTGTKEGCAEGDCGACTVLVGRLTQDALHYETVNACIRFLASLDGRHVVTIEHLTGPEGGMHPIQKAMVDHHGAQCGFCTPGIVMSLYALWMEVDDPTEDEIETALQGNLCRCTGYAPIIRAAQAAARKADPNNDMLAESRREIVAKLADWADERRVEVSKNGDRAILPASSDDLAAVLEEEAGATIVAGATDVGLWVTKDMRRIAPAVFIGGLDDMKGIEEADDAITLGGGVTYTSAIPALIARFPHLDEYWARIGGWQVRNMGTIGGNIANGSPIGDTPPAFIALGAELTLRKGDRRRTMPLEDFFIEYGRQDRQPGEFVESVRIPYLPQGARAVAWKISKRRDEDISTIALGATVALDGDRIASARLAFGGMAGTPKRAAAAEAALTGAAWGAEAFEAAAAALDQDFTPLDDWRATATYRMVAAKNLLRRFWLGQGAGEPTRLDRLAGGAR